MKTHEEVHELLMSTLDGRSVFIVTVRFLYQEGKASGRLRELWANVSSACRKANLDPSVF
jgi:hypothetical protein